MQVITLNQHAFEEHAGRLADMVASGRGSSAYDAIVGVKRGGSLVCDAFCRHFPSDLYALRTDVFLQRPSTRMKTGKVGAVLKSLPQWLLDLMRMAESRLLSLSRMSGRRRDIPRVVLPDVLARILKSGGQPEILVIDDAIDSGDTLNAVIRAMADMNGRARFRVAVMTVTTSRPVVTPDYCLYSNHTLIRFPWSNDYKE